MEVLDTIDVAVACPWQNTLSEEEVLKRAFKQIEKLYAGQNMDFETLLKNSISGDELVKRVHKHIDDWYDARERK